ncbi:hypothetical protein OF83DRAFT_1175873 [Amylostereum chailletii]|nr:hypothetical protein OF83DRAFT_1175873 [Amylostereum chailletii]
MDSLIVNNKGTKLTYIDSGAPDSATYITLVTLHGMGVNAGIYNRVSTLAATVDLRIVAVNRRAYGGSTPFAPEETALYLSEKAEDKLQFLSDRGAEFATFVDLFIQKFNTPPISADGKTGGVALLPWSAGNGPILCALGNIKQLAPDVQTRLSAHIRALILHEPPCVVIGIPPPQSAPASLFPAEIDYRITPDFQIPPALAWICSFFKHGDLTERDDKALSWMPIEGPPSLSSMSKEELLTIVEGEEPTADMRGMLATMSQAQVLCRKACFDQSVRAALPKMKVTMICGDVTLPFSLTAFWDFQDVDKANGGGFIDFEMMHGMNHFMHWEKPEFALDVFRKAALKA